MTTNWIPKKGQIVRTPCWSDWWIRGGTEGEVTSVRKDGTVFMILYQMHRPVTPKTKVRFRLKDIQEANSKELP